MSYSVSVSGHLGAGDDSPTVDSLKDAFENFIRALQAIDSNPAGQISGYEDGEPFTFRASDVQPLDAEDTSDDDEDTDSPLNAERAAPDATPGTGPVPNPLEDNDGEA